MELAIIIESSAILKVASTKVISDPQGYTSILVYLPGSPRLCQGPESKVGLELLGQLKKNAKFMKTGFPSVFLGLEYSND